MPAPLSESEVRNLLKPLHKAFDIDHDKRCEGHTQRVKDAAAKTFRQRSDEIKPTLHLLCSASPSGDITDVSLLAAMEETRLAAIAALNILKEQTNDCLTAPVLKENWIN
jgi:hypothetical protein